MAAKGNANSDIPDSLEEINLRMNATTDDVSFNFYYREQI
jgi:hypothetical protein